MTWIYYNLILPLVYGGLILAGILAFILACGVLYSLAAVTGNHILVTAITVTIITCAVWLLGKAATY